MTAGEILVQFFTDALATLRAVQYAYRKRKRDEVVAELKRLRRQVDAAIKAAELMGGER